MYVRVRGVIRVTVTVFAWKGVRDFAFQMFSGLKAVSIERLVGWLVGWMDG